MQPLILSTQALSSGDNKARIGDILPIRFNSDEVIVCMRQGRQLVGYQYKASTNTWDRRWSEQVFGQEGDYPLHWYPWLVADNLVPKEHLILLRHPNGIQFYQFDPAKPGLKLLSTDNKFNGFFSGSLLWGHFYPDTKYIGVMTRDVQSNVKFYASTLKPRKPPMSPLKINVPMPIWRAPDTEFVTTPLYHNVSEVIGLRTGQGLEFYRFNNDYVLERVAGTGHMEKPLNKDHLFFCDLTHQMYQDVLHLNDSGLFVYQYLKSEEDYRLLHRHTGFTESNGWLPHYSDSIRLLDLNGDGRDDLIFTGPKGITALSFDVGSKNWTPLLAELAGNQRFATVVGALPAMPPILSHPSLFMQDLNGNFQWAQVMQALTPTTNMPPLTTTTTVASTSISLLPRGDNPKQITRTNLSEKPTLRWTEQWDDGFMKEAVDPASGQVRFNIPLIDVFASTGWKLRCNLSYNSQRRTADLLGIGWTFPLGQDYIFVDHRGSIFPDDARYYLMAEGGSQGLKFTGNGEGGVEQFQLESDVEVQITHYPAARQWVVEGKEEINTYGKVSQSSAGDAIQWSLGWSNWRGMGRAKEHLQPYITAWYLKKRLSKGNQKTLYYQYEKKSAAIEGGNTYDVSLLLRSIEDGQDMKLTMDYAPKNHREYTLPKPIDKEGNIIFPIEAGQSHFLTGYTLITATYRQSLKFDYQVNDKKRVLTAIEQPIGAHTEPILRFSYQTVLGTPAMQSCESLSKGSAVQFAYHTLTPPASSIIQNHPIRERAKIAYGADYAIMAYRDLHPTAGKVILRIMNRSMTQTLVDCSFDSKLVCPSAESEITDFSIQAYQDSFLVLVESSQNRKMYIFNRLDKAWTKAATSYTFSGKAIVRFSETLIAAAEPLAIKLLARSESKNDVWDRQTITLSRALVSLSIQNSLLVGYDGHQLRLFYHDVQTGWKDEQIADQSNGIYHLLDKLDIDHEFRKEMLTALNQNSLQISNNCVMFNTIQENQGQLASQTHLFLIDARRNIAQKQSFTINRERILDVTYEHKDNDSVYKISYVKQNGLYKAQITAISGKIIEDLIQHYKIKNKNKKADFRNGSHATVKEHIKQLNQAEGWKEALSKKLLIDFSLYMAQIGQQGVYVGPDTLLRMTGVGWEKESSSTPGKKPQLMGKHFVLESDDEDQSVFKLYLQGKNEVKQGSPLKTLELHAPGQLLNQYPAYIAYHPNSDQVRVLTFKDEKTLGQFYTFDHEQLLPGSDFQNLITVANASSITTTHAEPQECRVRAISTLLPDKEQAFVNQVTLKADEDIERLTGYAHSFTTDESTHTETVAIMPGSNKKQYGWHEVSRSYNNGNVTKAEQWFNAAGEEVSVPLEAPETPEKSTKATDSSPNPMLLLDRSGQRLISDFSPYSLADEMVAYYGFEPYENDKIGFGNSTTKSWHINGGQIIKGGASFTGEHYLQLKATDDHRAYLEGILEPRDQSITYLAACWIRSETALDPSYLKAYVHTSDGQKIIGLNSEIKQQSGDWSYFELLLNFKVLKQIYKDYFKTYAFSNSALPLPGDAVFRIHLRVQAPANQTMCLDHIRFSPLGLDFQVAIYHPFIGTPTAIIQTNGLVMRTYYNHLQQEIGQTDEDGQVQEFTSSSRTGKLVPTPQGSHVEVKPSVVTFEPAYGFYENFDTSSWTSRWKLDDTSAWLVATGQLWHKQPGTHRMEAREGLFDSSSAAFRCYFALQESGSALSLQWHDFGSIKVTRQSNNMTNLVLPNGQTIKTLPTAGELIVMLEQSFLWLWVDGVLLVDQSVHTSIVASLWASFALEVQGAVLVQDCFVMNRPQVTVKYYNAFGDKTQEVQLEDPETALVSEVLYDELGREAITTKTSRIKREPGKPLLVYRSDFASNKSPKHPQSVWQTGALKGAVDRLNPADQGFAYTRTEYAPNPLNQKQTIGLPGHGFSITGPYATKMRQLSGIAFLDNLFPAKRGYYQKAEQKPNGSLHVSVYDPRNNEVAKYVQVLSYNHLLSTYEYDSENRLLKILPPLYHEKVDTAARLTPWQFDEDQLSAEEKEWQKALATRFVYDQYGRLIRKVTPDSGTTAYLYNNRGQKRFMAALDASKQAKNIVYFNYDDNGQLMSTGYIDRPLSLATLFEHLDSKSLPFAQVHQTFDYSDEQFLPLLRGREKQFFTNNDDVDVIEKLRFDGQQQVISKTCILSEDETEPLANIEKQYLHGKLQKLVYPLSMNGQPLELRHSYNRLGQLIGLGTAQDPTYYATFGYLATGQLAQEHYQPGSSQNFIRNYNYNAPGFLEQISDPFVSETIAYTSKGYGQAGYGDGMVMQATFNASWPANADGRWFQVRDNDLEDKHAAVCIKALKRLGYLTDRGQPIKLYVRNAETNLPLVCGGELGRRLAELIAKKLKPTYYGHRYAYGNHQELVKAKYFERGMDRQPLQPDSFAKGISGLTNQQSQHIWKLLTDAGYIITDQQRDDPATATGKQGVTFFRTRDLHNELAALNDGYTLYVQPIERWITSAVSQQRTVSPTEFETVFLDWQGLDSTSSMLLLSWQKGIASKIGAMLVEKGFLPTEKSELTHALNSHFTSVLQPYTEFIPKIVATLTQHFAHALGETAFDVEAFNIDANGNHQMFYKGFNRYELTYRNASNQIERIKKGWSVDVELDTPESVKYFAMKHDEQGNVVQALHQNIRHIAYHPVSQRTTRLQLTDGRTLRFYYDAQGERVLKRVFDAAGKVTNDTRYLRDEKGRVLVDRKTIYLGDGSTQQTTTAYLYGPRGMLGFIRDNAFYSVVTDHAGSIRLVIKDGSVVAAYDYLPYGGLMRSFGNDPQAHIVYRYTGQEWDEETGLYNYHARLYDPTIGRFYQIDPKAQYASPYVYAGNSPVSVIDPDGEFAFLLTCIVLAIVGAYLGGAAANNRWNPVDWDFNDSGTWLGIVGGGIAGGLLPLGFAASVPAIGGLAGGSAIVGTIGTVGLGVGGAYLQAAAASGSWNPADWKWDRPNAWSGLFQGFSGGSGIAGGIGIAHNFAKTGKVISFLGNIQKLQAIGIGQRVVGGVFLTVSYSAGVGVAYVRAGVANNNFAFWEWDWTSPTTWNGLVDGFDTGMGWPQNIMEMGRGVGRLAKNPKKYLFSGQNSFKLQSVLKNSNHPLYKTTTAVVMAYFMGSSANGDFDITNWNLAEYSTYEGVLNGIFFGKDITKTLKYIRNSKVQQPTIAFEHLPKNMQFDWSKGIIHILDSIQTTHKFGGFDRLVLHAFAESSVWLSKLRDQSSAIRNKVEIFFKAGPEKWKTGESRPPQELQRLIAEEARLNVQEESALTKWRAESEEGIRKQHEVHPEKDEGGFLNCKHARRRKRANGTPSRPFTFNKIEDQYTTKPSQYKVMVSIDGEEAVEKTSKQVYEYIQQEYSETMMPNKQKFISEHQKLVNGGYVLVGYHGTNEIAALSIMTKNEFRPTIFDTEPHWSGVYAAENLKLAVNGYAFDIEDPSSAKHARVLAVYAKAADIKTIGLTRDDINSIFGNDAKGFEVNKLTDSIIAGEDTSTKINEMVIKEGISLKATVLPIISEQDFEVVRKFFDLQELAQVINKNLDDLPYLEHIKTLRDLSPENMKKIANVLKMSGVKEIKGMINILGNLGLDWKGRNTLGDLVKFKEIHDNLKVLLQDEYGDFYDHHKHDLEKILKLDDLPKIINDFEVFKNSFQLKYLMLDNKNLLEATSQKLAELNQDSFKDRNILEDISKIKDVKQTAQNLNLLKDLDLPKEIESIFKRYDVDKVKNTFQLLEGNKGLSPDTKLILEDIFKIQDNIFDKGNYDKIKEILSLKDLSNKDYQYVNDYFKSTNNPSDAVEEFKAIKGVLEFKRLSDNDLDRARKILGLDRMQHPGFKSLRDYFSGQQGLNHYIEDFKTIRALLSSNSVTNEYPVQNLKNMLASDNVGKTRFLKEGISELVNLKEQLRLNEPTTSRSTAILEFYGKDDFTNPDNIEAIKNMLYPNSNDPNRKSFSEHDFKTVIGYFDARNNDLISSIDGFQTIKDVIAFKHLSDNDIGKAKDLLKLETLNEAEFKNLRDRFVAHQNLVNAVKEFNTLKELAKNVIEFQQLTDRDLGRARNLLQLETLSETNFKSLRDYFVGQPDLVRSVKDFETMKIFLETQDLPVVQNMRNELSLEKTKSLTKENFLVMKDLTKRDLNIPYDHTLHYAIKEAREEGAQVFYYCGGRSKRSIESLEFHTIESQDQFSNASWNITSSRGLEQENVTSSAGRLTPWTSSLFQMGKRVFHKVFNIYQRQKTVQPTSNSYYDQTIGTTQPGPTLLEMGDQLVNHMDTNGLLMWGTVLARKWTGYRPKLYNTSSYDPSTAIVLDIQSQELVHSFMGKVEEYAQACGIVDSAIYEDPSLYTQAIKRVRKQLGSGHTGGIITSMFEQIVRPNINKIAATATPGQISELLSKLSADLVMLEQQLMVNLSEPGNAYENEVFSDAINPLKGEHFTMPMPKDQVFALNNNPHNIYMDELYARNAFKVKIN